MPQLSVIVPVYKSEKYLSVCIESILKQSFNDFELILVEDGSPDNCSKICDDFAKKDKRIKVIHQKNLGVAVARNTGLDAATGEYVTFVDSDDYIDTVMYQKMIEVATDYNCDMVMCDCLKEFINYSEIYTHDIRAGFYDQKQLQEEYYPHLLIMPNVEYPATISNCLCLFKREISNKYVLYYEKGIRYSEDLLFGSQLLYHAKTFYYMKGHYYYHYRMNEQSATHKYVPDKWNDFQKLHKKIREYFMACKEFDFSQQIDLCLLFFVYNVIGDTFNATHLKRKERVKKIKAVLKSADVKEMFEKIPLCDLPISRKQKLLTWCYAKRIGIKFWVKYYEK